MVTLGKPSADRLTLSRFSALPVGSITFDVKNAGDVKNGFQVCTTPTTSTARNACVGKKTKLLAPGKSASLTVVLAKKGKYEVLSTLAGRAAAGMKALIGIGVKVAAPAGPSTPTPSLPGTTTTPTTTTTPKPGGGSIAGCARPQSSTIEVNEFEFQIALSQASVPCGPVTFNVHNTGKQPFDFALRGATSSATRALNPGESQTISANLAPGAYQYLCVSCDEHFEMEGQLTVSG